MDATGSFFSKGSSPFCSISYLFLLSSLIFPATYGRLSFTGYGCHSPKCVGLSPSALYKRCSHVCIHIPVSVCASLQWFGAVCWVTVKYVMQQLFVSLSGLRRYPVYNCGEVGRSNKNRKRMSLSVCANDRRLGEKSGFGSLSRSWPGVRVCICRRCKVNSVTGRISRRFVSPCEPSSETNNFAGPRLLTTITQFTLSSVEK